MKINLLGKEIELELKHLFVLFAIFMLAMATRGLLMKYELIFEFDTYWNMRIASYLLRDSGVIPLQDPLAYYQIGGAGIQFNKQVFWYTAAIFYKVFTLNAKYDWSLWLIFVKLLPALYGALECLGLYFLGKEIYDRKTGYIMAFFGAVSAAFVYRSMAGQFESAALGFLWMIIGFIFLLKAWKKADFKIKVLYSVISGISFALLSSTWGFFMLVPIFTLGTVVFGSINTYFEKNSLKDVGLFLLPFVISMFIFSIAATLYGDANWYQVTFQLIDQILRLQGFSLPLILGLLAVALIIIYIIFILIKPKINSTNISGTVRLVEMLLLYAALIILAFMIFGGKHLQRGASVLDVTIGEESLGMKFFGMKFNYLIILPILALIILPFLNFKKKNHYSLILFIWIFATLFMAYDKLKFTYTFGIPIAIGAGIVFYALSEFFKNRPDMEQKLILACFAILVFGGVASTTLYITDQVPNIEFDTGWKQGLFWLRDNTPQDAKIFNWWDEGHWITGVAERKVIIDNRNYDWAGDMNSAQFIISNDLNNSINIVKYYDSDYVMFGDDLLMKQGSLGLYAFNTTNFSDPRIQGYMGVGFNCSKNEDALTKKATYQCGGNSLPEDQMNQLPTQWSNKPNQMDETGRNPLFIYRAKDNSRLYIVNAKTNNTVLAKMWFYDPGVTSYFEEVYFYKEVKIFKINKDKLNQ